jgi:hypothetical protein
VSDRFLHSADETADRFISELSFAEGSQFLTDGLFVETNFVLRGLAVGPKRGRVQFDTVSVRMNGPAQAGKVNKNTRCGLVGFTASIQVRLHAYPANFGIKEIGERGR